jgi:hypothetical protein
MAQSEMKRKQEKKGSKLRFRIALPFPALSVSAAQGPPALESMGTGAAGKRGKNVHPQINEALRSITTFRSSGRLLIIFPCRRVLLPSFHEALNCFYPAQQVKPTYMLSGKKDVF